MELVQNTGTNTPFPSSSKLGDALKITSIKNGLIMRVDSDWFALCPPLIAEKNDIDELIELVDRSLQEALSMVGKN